MKGKFKKLILFTALLFAFILKVNAAGSVNVTLSGSNTVTVNAEYTISVNVSNVVTDIDDKKIYAVAGFVQFDPEYFQFVSAAGSNGFTATMNNSTYKMALIDMMMSTGASSGTIGTIKLKAIKTGSTSITINSASSTDYNNNNLQVNITPKSVTIEEAKSSNNKLASLEVVGHTLSPAFNANTKSYTVTVPADTTSVQVNATKADPKATLTLPGTNGLVTLSGNSTNATVKVTAENGSSTNYVVTINKQTTEPVVTEKSNDATLKSLDVSGFSLSPVFEPTVNNYSMRVNNNITALNVTAIPNHDKATVQISGNSGWAVGNNVITILVTAEDGTTTNTYYVTVTRAAANVKSSDTNIDLRILSTHVMEPVFNNSINEYEVTVPFDVTKLDMTITPYDKKTTVQVSGNENFEIGDPNLVTILVTAEDGTTKTVTLKVTRSEDTASADIIDLRVVGHTLNPEFKPSITEYKVNVGHKENDLNLIVKVAEDSTYEVTGNKDFKAGKNVVLIKVTDKNGYIKYYQIEVTKASKKALTFFGFPLIPFIIFLLLFLLLLFLLLLLLRRRKEEKEEEPVVEPQPTAPLNIEFKPEFNFGSKNGTDDDVFYSSGGPINNGSSNSASTEPKQIENVKEAEYDMYDDVVTKDELIDAINESLETNNTDKLQMLLEQERLNRRKEELRQQEQNRDKE